MKRFGAILLRTVLLACWAAQASAADLVVSAASSLTAVLGELKPGFEARHPGDHLLLNFSASGSLARQIEAGAPADVFISASPKPMDRLQARGLIVTASRHNLLSNSLVLVVPQGHAGLQGFSGLAEVARVAMGDPGFVPAGQYARQTLVYLKLWQAVQPRLVFGQDVRQVLEYVARGDVDAGLVFATDAALMPGRVTVVAKAPPGSHDPIRYPVAIVVGSRQQALARDFLDYLAAPASRALFEKHGFDWAVK
ncbi:MAG: molybdate ABC transporter substrate-binding protein [Betaproteobacteria bacterium]|nr:molybdate ABC transporter substrate-binding protein [Betaproteobacteria bacterium]MDE2623022.1 molybdate ABC transporter substrate-binding protein [Betaproteobacteria bacterium]